jgi:hypothetical protein
MTVGNCFAATTKNACAELSCDQQEQAGTHCARNQSTIDDAFVAGDNADKRRSAPSRGNRQNMTTLLAKGP